MKPLCLLVLTILLPAALAYMPPEARPIAAASPEGRYVVRITSGANGERAMVTIYELAPVPDVLGGRLIFAGDEVTYEPAGAAKP